MFHTRAFWGTILLILGVLLLLGNFEIIRFSFHSFWHIFWPAVIIVIGLFILFRHFEKPYKPGSMSFNFSGDQLRQFGNRFSRTFGDIKVDGKDMEIDGLSSTVTFGDTFLDLSGGKLKNGINTVAASSTFGDIRIIIPGNVEARVSASTTFGNINALGKEADGISNHIVHQTDGYDAAPSKIEITGSATFGDVKIFRA